MGRGTSPIGSSIGRQDESYGEMDGSYGETRQGGSCRETGQVVQEDGNESYTESYRESYRETEWLLRRDGMSPRCRWDEFYGETG